LGMLTLADFQDFHLYKNARRLGIAASLAIHAGLLLLLFSIPAAHMIPSPKTIHIFFEQEKRSSPERPMGIKPKVRLKTADVQETGRQEAIEKVQPRQRTERQAFLNDEPAAAAGQKTVVTISRQTGFSGYAKTADTGGKKEGYGSVVQTVFGTPGAPSFIRREIPVYPLLARRLGKEGTSSLNWRSMRKEACSASKWWNLPGSVSRRPPSKPSANPLSLRPTGRATGLLRRPFYPSGLS